MKKYCFILIILFFTANVSSQENYKKAIIPAKFEFQKSENQYRINTILKAYFIEKGFEAFLSNETLTEEFSNENCNKIFIDLENNSNLMVTKLVLKIKDCKNNILFTSIEGKSREKSLSLSYNEALIEILKSIKSLNFSKENMPVKTTTVVSKPIHSSIKINKKNLKQSSVLNVFFYEINNQKGIVFEKDKKWFFEYEANQKVISTEIQVEE